MNLKDLANHLGLSPTTVSRALNGFPEVNEETRRRVTEAARRANYRPNARAKGLATGRAQAIGHVIPISARHEMVNPVFGDFIAGAGEVYARLGYDMILTLVPDDEQERAYREIRSKGNVDGVIVHGPSQNDPRIPLLLELGLPFVVHGRATGTGHAYSWVDVNNTRAFRRATDFLLDLGHRRIGFVNGLEFMDFAIRRRHGYVEALTARDLAHDPELMAQGEMTETHGHAAARRMLRLTAPPTAFLASSLLSAMGVRRAVEEAGLVMGRDVSIVTHDDDLGYLKNGDGEPIYTATRSSVHDAGRRAATMLVDLIGDPASGPRTELLDAVLVVGNSTGPVRHPAG
jgi:LacI family transcriptional regulator